MHRLWFAACAAASAVALPPGHAAAQLARSPSNAAGAVGVGAWVTSGHRIRGETPAPNQRHRPRGRDVIVVGGVGWNEGWALYNNRTFAPDSFNDWWHDRPDRSIPRWMSDNRNCERVWWSGAGWRC